MDTLFIAKEIISKDDVIILKEADNLLHKINNQEANQEDLNRFIELYNIIKEKWPIERIQKKHR